MFNVNNDTKISKLLDNMYKNVTTRGEFRGGVGGVLAPHGACALAKIRKAYVIQR